MNSSDKTVIADVLQNRSTSYRTFSRLYLRPLSEADIDALAALDYVAVAQELKDVGALAQGFNDMGRFLRKRHTGTRQQLATDYTMCFDGVEAIAEKVAVPYASVFLSEKELLNQEPRHAVYKLFKAESVELKAGVNLPEDHLSFELEFLAMLSDRALAALEQDEPHELIRTLGLSRDFINEYILTWFDLLCDRALKILKTRFYRGVLTATKGYLELDLKTVADLIEEVAGE
ncbi:MAG: molecular chaperone TorD family protein [Coriobacteriales bacterium]|jgi:TorA maturation chaperone TorD|nr:molecular chaperone TorD family protein [Coriobacteriales bacterium]